LSQDRANRRNGETDLLPQPGVVQGPAVRHHRAERNWKVFHHQQLRPEVVEGEVRDQRHQLLGEDQRQLHPGGQLQ